MTTSQSHGARDLNERGNVGATPKEGKVRVHRGYAPFFDQSLDDISRSDPMRRAPVRMDASQFVPIPCPCCGQVVSVPALDIIVDHYKIAPMPARILRAVWNGKGHPVKSERIFDVMYEDDPDGGPHLSQMYNALKIGIWRLRNKLEGSGIAIESAGYGQGYRLKIGE